MVEQPVAASQPVQENWAEVPRVTAVQMPVNQTKLVFIHKENFALVIK